MAIVQSIFNIFILLFTFTKLSLCLYEDQVGKFDWKQSYVGKIKYASFESAKRIIVATEENVVAALSLKNGHILWRHILEDPITNKIELLHVDKEIVVVSGDGSTFQVRGWDVNNGMLLWEWSMYTEKTNAKWVVIKGQLLHVVPVINSHLEVTEYEVQTGHNRGATSRISTPWISDLSKCVMADTYWSCVCDEDSNAARIYYLNVATNSESSKVYSAYVNSLIGNEPGRVILTPFKYTEPAVLLTRNAVSRLIILQDVSPRILPNLLSADLINIENGDQTVFVSMEIVRDGKENSFKIKTMEADGVENTVEATYVESLGTPTPLVGVCRGAACRVLFTTSDDAVGLLQLPTGKILWIREEALSNIVGIEFIELPVSDLDASIEREFMTNSNDVINMLYLRLLTQSRQLVSMLVGKQTTTSGLVRDEFGLHKLILAVTKVGKLFAIDTLTGEVVWSKILPKIKPFMILDKPVIMLLEQRNARYSPLLAECALLALDSSTENGVLYRFDPITGNSVNGVERLPYRIKQVMLLPYEDSAHLKGLVILSHDNKIHLYPDEMGDILKNNARSTFMFSVESKPSVLNGYTFMYSSEDLLKVTPTWKLTLEPSKIVAIGVRPNAERVHSQGRVLADRSVLYKYVNPNLIALATVSEDPLHKHVLSIYLIDGVTGLVVYSANHKRAKEPVHLVHSENWVVYSYFSERFRRVEMAAIELYEGARQSNSTAFSSLALSQLPHVETLSYILPGNPLAMVSTLTERGITSKHLLIALSNGAVTELPWMFLEPRGPHIFSGLDEGMVPYMPELPLVSEATINYYQTLGRVKGINVSPARLESTSLVLVHGLDLFYTRVTPSKTFDMLKEDFDHWLIVMVLVGLIFSSYLTKHLASRKALKQAWK